MDHLPSWHCFSWQTHHQGFVILQLRIKLIYLDESKVPEKPPTNVNETCIVDRKYPDKQTPNISGTIDDDILFSSVLKKRRLYTHFPGIKLDFTFTNQLGKIVLISNNKDCCTRVKNKWCSNLLGTGTRVFSPEESRSHRGIIRDKPVKISMDDIKNGFAGAKEEEIQVIRYIKGGKAIPLVEVVFQKECTFNKYLQNEITLEFMYFKMDPKRTTKIQCFNCQQWGSHVSKICKNQSWCAICGYEHPTNRHEEYVCQEKHEHTKIESHQRKSIV